MKMLVSFVLIMAFALPVFAGGNGSAAFPIYSAASGAVKTSAVYDVRKYKTKTLTVTGVTINSNAAAATFKTMSGTAIVQCAPTTSGPWSTCTQSQVASAPAVSLTANNQLTWADAVAYIRFKWTAATSGQKIKAFLNWLEE